MCVVRKKVGTLVLAIEEQREPFNPVFAPKNSGMQHSSHHCFPCSRKWSAIPERLISYSTREEKELPTDERYQ
jgi:hypothetical protein